MNEYAGARAMCAMDLGLDLNGRLGFDVLTRDEYECVGRLSVSKPITSDDMSDWFLGYDLGPQVNDSMFELFYECGDVRRYVAGAIIDWWGDDLGVGLGDAPRVPGAPCRLDITQRLAAHVLGHLDLGDATDPLCP